MHDETSLRPLADEVTAFIHANGLTGIDVAGSSMGELPPRGSPAGQDLALRAAG